MRAFNNRLKRSRDALLVRFFLFALLLGLSFRGVAHAGDKGPCKIATKGDSPTAKACASGGRDAATKLMKDMVKEAKSRASWQLSRSTNPKSQVGGRARAVEQRPDQGPERDRSAELSGTCTICVVCANYSRPDRVSTAFHWRASCSALSNDSQTV